uniref:Maltase n=1 Tax=Astyanax mexicanus TaxID=7994 RepID=A0A8B9HXV6_ASTMX
MGRRRFSGLEITLMVMFVLIGVVSIALIVLLATGEPATVKEGDLSFYLTVLSLTDNFEPECPNIVTAERVDCHPEPGLRCQQRGCCWNPLDQTNVPWCYFPRNHGYTVISEKRLDSRKLALKIPSPNFFFITPCKRRTNFLSITNLKNDRFEVPHEHIKSLTSSPNGPLNYELEVVHNPFGVRVRRASNKKILFDTTVGPLVFDDQYLQLSAKLGSDNIYGLGEHVHQNFRHDLNWRTWPIFSRDSFPNGGTHNLYGHYPYFTCLEDSEGKSFGVFLMNSNAMEVTLQPAPAITYRTIGGVLDFYIMLADTPKAITQEFTELVGRPTIPPYWALGFQLSRWDYGSLDEVKRTVERNRAIGIPYDTQYTDIDYMENQKDFTYDLVNFKDLPQFADYMHAAGQKYILILDPAIATTQRINGTYESYDRGTQFDAWVMEASSDKPLVGEVWPGETVFPDYTKESCINWWVDEIERFYKEVKHDAIWIDMNEVSSFVQGSKEGCANNKLNYPPFTPRILDDLMYSKTLCMDARQGWGNHYDVHSLYGYSMVLATDVAVKKVFGENRSFILTRSSFPGVGKYSGHWLGDNAANWNDIKWAIPGMLEFSLFGVPYVSMRSMRLFLNIYYKIFFLSLSVQPQDPAAYGADSLLVQTSIHYMNIRYTLLPYLYTLFYKSHTSGDTVVRPVMNEFFSDSATWTVDRQFLWGPHLLITPVLDAVCKTHIDIYFYSLSLFLSLSISLSHTHTVSRCLSQSWPCYLATSSSSLWVCDGDLHWDALRRDGDLLFFSSSFPSLFSSLSNESLSLELGKSYTVKWDGVVSDFERVDCYPEEGSNEEKCTARGCIWQTSNLQNVPWCYFPADYGYTADTPEITPSGISFNIARNTKYPVPRSASRTIDTLRVEINYLNSHSLRFKIFDPANERYEVPVPISLPPTPDTDEARRMYEVQVTQNPFGIKVIRKSTGTVVWDSSLPGFTFSDMFIQISTRLPSQYIYGFGETEHESFRHDLNWHTWGMFSKDQPPGVSVGHVPGHGHTQHNIQSLKGICA